MSTDNRRALAGRFAGTGFLLSVALLLVLSLATASDGHGAEPSSGVCPAICLSCPMQPQYYGGWEWGGPVPGGFDHVHETCNMINCAGGACGETFLPSGSSETRVAAMIESRDVLGLIQTLAELPEQVKYNEQRHAIQVIGCGGLPVAHIPLSPVISASFVMDRL